MPLGNPIRKQNESRIVSVLATEGQTVFTVQDGYIINHLSVFRNGVRLSNSEDFTAGDGSTVTLNNAANIDDRIEFHVFDRFTVQNAIVSAASTQTISGDVVVNGKIFGNLDVPSINTGIVTTQDLNVTGVGTFTGVIDANGGATIDNIRIGITDDNTIDTSSGNLKLSASGDIQINDNVDLNGTLDLDGSATFDKSANNLVFKDDAKATFGDSSDLIIFHDGTLSKIQNSSSGQLEIISNDIDLRSSTGDKNYFTAQVGGAATVFYDNSVRIATSTTGADVTGTLNVTGVSTFSGDVNFGDATSDTVTFTARVDSDLSPSGSTRDLGTSGVEWRNLYTSGGVVASDTISSHASDSDTKIRFPAANTFTVETAGSERLRIHSSGFVGIGTNVPNSYDQGGRTLVLDESGNFAGITIRGSQQGSIYFADGLSGIEAYRGRIEYKHTDDALDFGT